MDVFEYGELTLDYHGGATGVSVDAKFDVDGVDMGRWSSPPRADGEIRKFIPPTNNENFDEYDAECSSVLNLLGRSGWELVSMIATGSNRTYSVFKRKVVP